MVSGASVYSIRYPLLLSSGCPSMEKLWTPCLDSLAGVAVFATVCVGGSGSSSMVSTDDTCAPAGPVERGRGAGGGRARCVLCRSPAALMAANHTSWASSSD